MIPSRIVAHHRVAEDAPDEIDEDGVDNNDRGEAPSDRHEERNDVPDLAAANRRDASNSTKPLYASDRTRRIILENLGRVEKKTLREFVANADIVVANSSFDTIYYETNKTMQIAREMGLVSWGIKLNRKGDS
jgi:hypothetical protein